MNYKYGKLPIPPKRSGRPHIYDSIFGPMEIGQCITFDCTDFKRAVSGMASYARRSKRKFTTRRNIHTIWRIK